MSVPEARDMKVESTGDGQQLELGMPGVLYDQRFLETHVGRTLLTDPVSAIVELVANAWDAGATSVAIAWPSIDGGSIVVRDNGTGMTDSEFSRRWRKLNYNRRAEQGAEAAFPLDAPVINRHRQVFGRNGIGRWAAFCFDDSYAVDTATGGSRNRYHVRRGTSDYPFVITREVADETSNEHGTSIFVSARQHSGLTAHSLRAELGMRFLTDPDFAVRVNGEPVTFEDISASHIDTLYIEVPDGSQIQVTVIDTQVTDRTSRQKGVAWHVGGRLVGKCSWDGPRAEAIIDRRRVAARRFTFIVRADHLAESEAVKPDWSGFDEDNEAYKVAADLVYDAVERYLLSASGADRERTLAHAKERNSEQLRAMTPLNRDRWLTFVTEAQENCPRVREDDVLKLSEIMANLELTKSGYGLLHKLAQYGPEDLDDLHRILSEWTLDMAKVVLDEISKRLQLVEELQARVRDERSREVQDLQPLFEKGLWIFGPEFETIEYTSNSGMTRVIQGLFQVKASGSLLRPDFAILPDSTVGLYSYPRFDEQGADDGIDRLVIIELKRPGVRIGNREKDQCWRYVKELMSKGLVQDGTTKVTCFLLGSEFEPHEMRERVEGESVVIRPMAFEIVLSRAKSRMLGLHQRVQEAPFLQAHRAEIQRFLEPLNPQAGLFEQAAR